MQRWLPWAVAVAVLAAGWLGTRAEAWPDAASGRRAVDVLPAGEGYPHGPMDHGEPDHHHHQHQSDHRGKGHMPDGLGEHHHHHHDHPHPADPHHHHPH